MATGASNEPSVDLEVRGLDEFVRVLGTIPRALDDEFKRVTVDIANDLAAGARNAARTPLQALAVRGLEVDTSDPPALVVGGTMVRPGTAAIDIWYGAEYGGGRRPTTKQFQPWLGQRGYFLTPVARERGSKYNDMYGAAIEKAMQDWDHKE